MLVEASLGHVKLTAAGRLSIWSLSAGPDSSAGQSVPLLRGRPLVRIQLGAPPEMSASSDPDIAAAVARHGAWYHVLELGHDVVTPGYADLRPVAPSALPDSLAGRRCLDVGTFDGFWAFEMERRGAAEVVALDVPDPARTDMLPSTRARYERGEMGRLDWGAGFRIARAALGSSVRRVEGSVYDLTPATVGGAVDFVLCGTLLQHLRDPVGALERIRETLAPDGALVVVETVIDVPRRLRGRPIAEFRGNGTGLYTWWVAGDGALADWLATAGFASVTPVAHHALPGLTPGDRLAVVSASSAASAT
jgi:SAM-dependent methyltransferase